MGAAEHRGMHGVKMFGRIVHRPDAGRALDHVGSKAVAVGKAQPPRRRVAVVPDGQRGVQRGAGLDGQHRGTGGRDRIGGSGIATHVGAIEQHLIEILKKGVIHQPVEMAIDLGGAEPCLTFGNDAQMRPAARPRDRIAEGHLARRGRADRLHPLKAYDKDRGAFVPERRPVPMAQRLEMAGLVKDLVHPFQPAFPVDGPFGVGDLRRRGNICGHGQLVWQRMGRERAAFPEEPRCRNVSWRNRADKRAVLRHCVARS